MRLYIFKSEAQEGLQAFAGDPAGSKLPSRFAPWHAVGVVAADKAPPHQLPRADIERAVEDSGFQLWRRRARAKQA